MQRGHPAEALHLINGEIAHADGADLALLVKRAHRLGGFLHRHQRVGPMNLVDVDVIGAQTAQRIIDLLHDASSGCIPIDLAVAPFESRLGGDDRLGAHALESGADDLLGHAEAVYRRGIDQIDALIAERPEWWPPIRDRRFLPTSSRPSPTCRAPPARLSTGSLEYVQIQFQRSACGPALTMA